MPFDALLQRLASCLIHGTSFAESGGRVSVRPEPDETVGFFVIDDNTNANCTFRQDFGVVGAICDLLVSYAKENRKLLCLVESKGRNIRRGVEQILNAHRHLRQALNQSQALQQIGWKAYIYQHGASPSKTDRTWIKNQLEQTFGRNNFRISRQSDLGDFLRR